MHIEIEHVEQLNAHILAHRSLSRVVVQAVDLRSASEVLRSVSGAGATFLGCVLEPSTAEHLRASGALLLPQLGDRPYCPYRARLYTPAELYEGTDPLAPRSFFEHSLDARIYAWYQAAKAPLHPPALEALAQRLHDHSVEDAKHDLIDNAGDPLRCVAIMGGHAMRRDEPAFAEVAAIARALARRGYFLVSGGGPGAMEATNLGAWLAPHPDEALPTALEMLAPAPHYRDEGWIPTAMSVLERFADGAASLAIPTWFYGHEPTNFFATHVAKFFSNSLREDGLLAIATHGVIYAPGSAGTVQEVFMDGCQNHYGTVGVVSPMVFLGQEYWERRRPVRALLDSLSEGRQYAERISYVDSVDEAVAAIVEHPPVAYDG